jgi:hypothetical protein
MLVFILFFMDNCADFPEVYVSTSRLSRGQMPLVIVDFPGPFEKIAASRHQH